MESEYGDSISVLPYSEWRMYEFELELDEPDRVYFSGDEITGQVLVHIGSCLAVQAVTIGFVGEACLSVPESVMEEKEAKPKKPSSNKISPGPNVTNNSSAKPCWVQDLPGDKGSPGKAKSIKAKFKSKFSAREKYFVHKEFIYGHKYSSYREQLREGSHTFRFNFTLPLSLPASFSGRYGYVRYYCESTLLRWKDRDTRRRYFSVTNVADMNNEAKAESGCEEEKSTNSCLFCCARGTIIASAELRRRGYACGEVAPLSASIHNMSSSKITNTKAMIIQMVTYTSSQGQRRYTDERRVLEASKGAVAPGISVFWTPQTGLKLPALPPSSFAPDSCKIIHIEYRIEVLMTISGEKEPLVLRLPLIVGNVPLKRNFPLLLPVDDVQSDQQPPLNLIEMPEHITHRYPTLPCVTSEESVNPAQIECVYRLPEFKPKYLVYIPKPIT